MGFKGVIFLYVFLWCKIYKDKRWEIDKYFYFFNFLFMMRILLEIKELVKKGKGDCCCVKVLFLNIDFDYVIVDELYLLLCVMDVMLDNIIIEVIDWGKDEDFEKIFKEF